ncbi:MAG: hypothetical protein ACOZNI_09750 [Myxococcota bacterium]
MQPDPSGAVWHGPSQALFDQAVGRLVIFQKYSPMDCRPLTVRELREIAECNIREGCLSCPTATALRSLRDAAATACFEYRSELYRGPVYVVWWTLKGLLRTGVEVYVRGEDGALRSARLDDAESEPRGIRRVL